MNGRKFNDTADFLYLTDDDIYSLVNRPEFGLASRLASDLKYRNGIFPKGRWFYPLKL